MRSVLVIILPTGLELGGVSTWARSAARAVSSRGGLAVFMLGRPSMSDGSTPIDYASGARIIELSGPLAGVGRRIDPAIMSRARDDLSALLRPNDRVVLAPTLSGDAYGLAIELGEALGDCARTLGVLHSEYSHDLRVIDRYTNGLSVIAGVGERGVAILRERSRRDAIFHIPHGVACPEPMPVRDPLPRRPVRLVYAGRLERDVKRVLACVWLADELSQRRIGHEIAIIGDGPARADVMREASSRPSIGVLGPKRPDELSALLARADALLLPSRHEALAYARLEAAALGCIPIVTDTGSGHGEGIEDMRSGVLCPSHRDDDEPTAAAQLAQGISRLLAADPPSLARGAREMVRKRYPIERHADALHAAIHACFDAPPIRWDHRVPTAFDAFDPIVGSGSVPPDAPARARRAIERLGDRPIAVHGAGRHTLAVWDQLTAGPARVVAIIDDDPARWGAHIRGVPIIGPGEILSAGARDVLISSWLHERDLRRRCAPLEAMGVRVHAMYDD